MKVSDLSLFDLFTNIVASGGITYSVRGRRVIRKGYAVSPYKDREQVLQRFRVEHLRGFIGKNRDLLDAPGHCLGAWINPDNGLVYLDVSIVVGDSGQANALALRHKQLAFFDLNRGETVRTVEPWEFERFARSEVQ